MDALATLSFLPLRLSRNPVAYSLDAAPDSIVNRNDLAYVMTIKKPAAYGSGEFTPLIVLPGRELPKRSELGADVYPGAEFDVRVFLDDFLKRTPPQPDQRGMVTCGDMVTPFLVQTRVTNAGVLVPGTDKTLPLEFALKGGLGVEQFAGWREQFFTTFLSNTRQFLTWQPNEKWVETNQPEFLYYLVNFTPKPAEIRLKVAITYGDASVETLTLLRAPASQYTVYSMPVGFTALALADREVLTGKLVLSYQVWVSNEADGRLSAVRTYYVNRDYEPNRLFLLFANSLGGYDTLRCTGQSGRTLTVTGTPAQRALVPSYLPSTSEFFSLNRLGERVLTVNTGLLDGHEMDYLSELALTEEIYVAGREGFVALVPTETALNLRQDDEDLAGRTLTYRYAKNETGFSNLPAAPAVPTRATMWVPANTYCLVNENGVRTGLLVAAKLELRYTDDGSLVKPLRSKANTPGTVGYTAPTLSGACTTTPFLNGLVQQAGTVKPNNCGADQEPAVATLSIAAGTYGAETPEQLQARIDQALRALDTQAYANQYGSCLANPAAYSYSVPANRWHYRSNAPRRIGLETADAPYMGNAWTMQGRGGSFVFATGSNDLDFPSTNFSAYEWRFFVTGPAGATARLRFYKNGVVYRDTVITFNPDGYEYLNLTEGNLVSGDKIYLQVTDQ